MTIALMFLTFLLGMFIGLFVSKDIFCYVRGEQSYFKKVYDFIIRFSEEREINK